MNFLLNQYKLWSYVRLCWAFDYVALLKNEFHKN